MKLQLIKKTAIAAALSFVAAAASAMTPMQDDSLSQVSGQDGVSIGADLNVNIGSFVYTNTADATGNSALIRFNNIQAHGLIAATIDVISNEQFGLVRTAATVGGSFFNPDSDVVQIAVPSANVADAGHLTITDTSKILDVSVASIQMGGSTASFGSFAMNDIDLRGTKVWMWAH